MTHQNWSAYTREMLLEPRSRRQENSFLYLGPIRGSESPFSVPAGMFLLKDFTCCLDFQIVALEKTLESLLDCKEIQPVHPKGNQHWIFIGRTDAEAEAPILWPPDVKSWFIGKGSDAGKDWGQEEKGATEDKMVRQHHQLNGHEFEETPGDSEGQGSLVCCSPWGCKELDTT